MKQSRYLAILIVLCSVSMVFAMSGGGGSSSQKTHRGFEGKVTDENGKVLSGVQVTLFH